MIPSHVRALIKGSSLNIVIQPSVIRIFSDEGYAREGARVDENLSPCSVIFAIKEIPLHFFEKEKAYVFFSHTVKGQPHNMPMLKKMIELQCTLIDYEKIVDENGFRIVFFGKQAGQAGMIDTLWALGKRLKYEGSTKSFSPIKQASQYQSLVEVKEEIKKVGWKIHKDGLDLKLVPLICGFTGYGHVSQGAQEMFDLLPNEEIAPQNLMAFINNKKYSSNKVYKVVFKEEHIVRPAISNYNFELQDYYDNPEKYKPVFATYLPFLTVLVNCIYWTPKYPRLVTKDSLKQLWNSPSVPRLKVIGDISCDVEGSIECTVHSTSPDNPVFVYDPIEEKANDGIRERGVVVMAVDNLPAELPLESSIFFSHALNLFVPAIAHADFSGSIENCHLPDPIMKAVILYKGKFTPDYEYMKEYIK